ncbi:PQQ-dependent sugar dehydrogenase [Streptomyces spectabilis]|uniref:Glucose/arabinose dehydrogenase n=1 Tax=Streptomyces spectabilis TaxID=68270 RepID=A0A5P2XF26_STRST|nr:PQQ-dependent sugar dehydrogenase [Streptomyces spectabilis]MBB5104314.1 glucose/arabinose dehydrogenase [Streptomyces spectabilis]MCI3905327.1 PQQ-dependent sugar dehydrogenase [Streptomyces spectabilis]QEV62324.1 PQQ-dependent sugar dehydrogenase [Streptomyces spectabilis]
MTATLATTLLLATGCSSDDADPADGGKRTGSGTSGPTGSAPDDGATPPPEKGSAKVTKTLATGLKSPWGLAALPGGDLLVSSRDEGTITHVDGATGKKTEVGTVPGVAPGGEGGLMGLALSPTYATDHFVYAYFTTASDNRVARMLYDEAKPADQRLGAPDTIFKGIPKGSIHNGGRIAFGPDKLLYVGTGETGDTGLAQDKKSLGGKILRLTPDGEPAPGNPFENSPVYSYGHRNVQGLAWDEQKRLWASEFGQDTWDELNEIKAGDNYGWPEVEGKDEADAKEEGFHDPVAQWKTSEASPSGVAYAEGSVWMAGLRGQRLWRVPVRGAGGEPGTEAFLTEEHGRLRTVLAAGGDKLWLVTSETDSRGTPEKGDDKILEVEVK